MLTEDERKEIRDAIANANSGMGCMVVFFWILAGSLFFVWDGHSHSTAIKKLEKRIEQLEKAK